MKKILLFLIGIAYVFAFEGTLIKNLSKVFSKEAVEMTAKRYGDDGIRALDKLSVKYGNKGISKLEAINAKYGQEGLKLVAKYGDEVVKNEKIFEIVSKFKDKGYYLIKKFPQKSVEYYEKFGDKFVKLANKFGPTRVVEYLDEAKKYNADGKIIRFLDNFGERANKFLNEHWGKLLASGFVLLNADDIIKSLENVTTKVGEKAVTVTGDTITTTVSGLANSTFGLFAGISLILFIIFKYGWDFFVKFISIRKK